MRTKILKFGMPLMAFLLAIVFAFAAEKSTPVEGTALITGYISNPGGCQPVLTNCALDGTKICTYSEKSVHKNSDCGPVFLWERMN